MNVYRKSQLPTPTMSIVDDLTAALSISETILRNRRQFFTEIRNNVALGHKIQAMALCSTAFLALYGAVMGSSHSFLQALSSAIKLPILFLLTSLICIPTLYFFNILLGARQNFGQNLALLLTPITVTATLLFSFAPISLFFMLTTDSYQFFKLLNVAFFAVAGWTGMVFLAQGMQAVSQSEEPSPRLRHLGLYLWMIVYGFVGSQMAWTIRPFVGYPDARFELIREFGGNFYSNILLSLGEVLGFLIVR